MNVTSYWWLLLVVTKLLLFVDANWITGNLCWSMPCMNGGSCFGSAYTYLCVCPVNYTGALCEKRLGICQENPCGNRGLCVETGLTSFECRCYFDYMGPLCEEHVTRNDPSVWSSLIPVHTRVLFDILQEAYRAKAQGKSVISSELGQLDIFGLLSANNVRSTLSPTFESTTMTSLSETTETEHIIPAVGIQIENIFPDMSTASTSDVYTENFKTQVSSTLETTEQYDAHNDTILPTYFETVITSTIITPSMKDSSTTTISLENTLTTLFDQNQTTFHVTQDEEFIHTTKQSTTMTFLDSTNSNSDNNTRTYTIETTQQINDTVDSKDFVTNVTSQTNIYTSSEVNHNFSNQTDDNLSNSTMITIDQSLEAMNMSQATHSQLLYKLCQQLLSHILPNVSSTTAVKAALALATGSLPTGNNSVNALLTWIKDQYHTSTSTLSPLSSLPSLTLNGKKSSLDSLQRIDIDDALYQMNNDVDEEQ